MEEAYRELYQQFLQLKALCLRQAALLHQLTEALQRHDGPAADPAVGTPERWQEPPGPSSGDPSQDAEGPSDLLAAGMSRLAVDGGRWAYENHELGQNVPPLRSLEPLRWPGGGGAQASDGVSAQADGMLMSDVALQSHICDFCQAVFPGDTSTRGDFLRHLYTHVT